MSLLETIVIWILLIWQVKVTLKNVRNIMPPSSWKLLVMLKLILTNFNSKNNGARYTQVRDILE